MPILPNEIKIYYNVLTGAVRILSATGRFEYSRLSEPKASTQDRIKDLIVLLRIVRKLKSHQTTITGARKKLIEAQICRQLIERSMPQ